MKKSRMISGVLVGSLVGAGIALLSATHSGKETRAMIAKKSIAIKEKVASTVDGTRVQIKELTSTIADETQERLAKLKNAAQKFTKAEASVLKEGAQETREAFAS